MQGRDFAAGRVWGWMLTLVVMVSAPASKAGQVEELRLVPFPKEITPAAGLFSLEKARVFQVSGPHGRAWGEVLNSELARAGFPAAQIITMESKTPGFRLAATEGQFTAPTLPQTNAPEAYALEARATEVAASAKEQAGLFYALQTLCQLIRANRTEGGIPCVTIRDWPSLRWRCFQDDMTRGPSSTLDFLKWEASLGSYLKFNLMTFYMEYQYSFKKHPEIGPTNGSLTGDELSALVNYVKPFQLDILGNQQSFGHFGAILKHAKYAALRETPDVLTPAHEETYQLLDDLYAEVCPLLPFPWFNVCCDETWGLGTGPSKELAQKIGVGGVYAGHMKRIHELLKEKYHKRMMMWGDIILQHPKNLTDIPKDTLMLIWGYDARASFEDQIVPFSKSGYEFFVCPGVNNWSRILPDFGVAVTNIHNFVRDGVKHNALGMLNTDWEDDGEALNATKWHADAWAAECAWNASKTPYEQFNRRAGAVLFGEKEARFGTAVDLLARTHRLPGMKGMNNARFWEKDFVSSTKPETTQQAVTNLLSVVRPALDQLAQLRREAGVNQRIAEAFEFGTRRMELIGQRMLDGLEVSRLYREACEHPEKKDNLVQVEQLVRKNRDAHEALRARFAELWLSESKPYALDWTLRRYTNTITAYSTLLEKCVEARKKAESGAPLPSPAEMGFMPAK